MDEQKALEILGTTRHGNNICIVRLLVFDWTIGTELATLGGLWSREELEAASWLMSNAKPV